MMNDLAFQIHKNSVDKGFYDAPKNIGEMLALIHSEVSEALEADRKDRWYNSIVSPQHLDGVNDLAFKEFYERFIKGTFQDEMADIIIRVLDMCSYKHIDIEDMIKIKMRYNAMREHKHGKKY